MGSNYHANNSPAFISTIREDLLRLSLLTAGKKSYISGPGFWMGLFSPRFIPVFIYRLSSALYDRNFSFLSKSLSLFNFIFFGLEIYVGCKIGPGLVLPHTQGTVIGAYSIGNNATIFNGVTLGAVMFETLISEKTRPIVGNDVTIGAGAKVLGGVSIGDRVKVGANAVVITSIPSGFTAVGVPSRNYEI